MNSAAQPTGNNGAKPTILIVDDVPENIDILREILRGDFKIKAAINGRAAVDSAVKSPPDLILMDIQMPELDGYSACRQLKANPATKKVPIIFVTASGEAANEERGFSLGAADFMTKPVVPAIVRARVRAHLALYDQTRLLEELVDDRTKQLRDEMHRREKAVERIRYMHHYHHLTGLPNRQLLSERMGDELARSDTSVALALLDIDRFGAINDALGSDVGDTLLLDVAKALESQIGGNDMLAHIGGDVYALLMVGAGRGDEPMSSAAHRVERVLNSAARRYEIFGEQVSVSFSAGLAVSPEDGADVESLLKNAEAATKFAKSDRAQKYCFYREEMNASSRAMLVLEAKFLAALEKQEIKPWYQPKVHSDSLTMTGCEALARWITPEGDFISPGDFIPLSCNIGMAHELTQCIIGHVFHDAARWLKEYDPNFRFALNLAAEDFQYPGLINSLDDALRDSGCPVKNIELEITEQALIEDPDAAREQINTLRAKGFSIALDDFGTGHSSLSYLRSFALDTLKIDQSFIRDLGQDPTSDAITETIIRLGQHLSMHCVAEGVETSDQLAWLQKAGSGTVQGYLFSAAVDAAKFEKLLKTPQFSLSD